MDAFWIAVIVGSLAVYSWKLLGYLIPKKISENKSVATFAALLTVALLAALAAVQTVGGNQSLEFDSRMVGVGLAAILFWRKLPFLLVITLAAAATALLRFLTGAA